MLHTTKNKFAGKTVKLKPNIDHPQVENGLGGKEYRVEDWWDRVGNGSWMHANGNPACIVYAMRSAFTKPPLPVDDEVLYGKVGLLGHLIHISEIENNHKEGG